MENEHVLVIGGAGYIGSHVARELLDRKYRVTIFDNLSTGSEENIQSNAEATFFKGDIRDYDCLAGFLSKSKYDSIIHLAALKSVEDSMLHPERYMETNVEGSRNIIKAALRNNIKRLIFSSTAAVYGNPEYLPIDERHPTKPTNFYGRTKLAVEEMLKEASDINDFISLSLRYFNAAGYDPQKRITGLEKNPQNLLPIVMETALGLRDEITINGNDYDTKDGTCIRDYVHVSDLARAHVLALEKIGSLNENNIINLGSHKGYSVKEIIERVRNITKKEIKAVVGPRRIGDVPIILTSNKRAHFFLGWQPKHTIDDIIETTWNIYRKK
jgi:UDP-glucose 4-epimerase